MKIISQCVACGHLTDINSCQKYANNGSDNKCVNYIAPYDNSGGMFKRLFSFKGRIRRTEFCAIYAAYFSLYVILSLLSEVSAFFAVVLLICLIPATWILYAALAKRLHDVDKSAIYMFMPVWGYVLLLSKGDDTPNRYGTDPRQGYEEQLYK